jgi:hypothetical protein
MRTYILTIIAALILTIGTPVAQAQQNTLTNLNLQAPTELTTCQTSLTSVEKDLELQKAYVACYQQYIQDEPYNTRGAEIYACALHVFQAQNNTLTPLDLQDQTSLLTCQTALTREEINLYLQKTFSACYQQYIQVEPYDQRSGDIHLCYLNALKIGNVTSNVK